MKKIDFKHSLRCPCCHDGQIEITRQLAICTNCLVQHPVKDGKILFAKPMPMATDPFDKFKNIFKQFSGLYSLLMNVISPTCPNFDLTKFINKNTSYDKLFVNLGSGNSKISPNVINFDLMPYENVDITGDIMNLPFLDNSLHGIVNIAVLEHVPEPEKAVAEMLRVMKKDGVILCVMPFIFPFHASPYDYSRRTYEGIKYLFKDFEIEEIKLSGGPTSAMLAIFQEFFASMLSFGNKYLYILLYLIIMTATCPIKFLDLALRHHPYAKNVTTNFTVIAKKK